MLVKDLVKWHGEDCEIYSACVNEDVEINLEEQGIPKEQWDEYKEEIRRLFGKIDIYNEFISEIISSYRVIKKDVR